MVLKNISLTEQSKCYKCQKVIDDEIELEMNATWRNPVVIQHKDCKKPYGEPKPEVVAVTQKEVVVEETKVEDIGEVDIPNSREDEVTVEDGKDKDEKGTKTRKKH